MLRGLTRQLTSLSAFAEARLATSAVPAGITRDCLAPAWCVAARLFSTNPQQFKNVLYNKNPEPLDFIRPHWAPAPGVEESFVKRTMLRLFGFYSKETTMMRAAQGLYDGITEAVDDKRLMEALELPADFQHMHALLCLHVWLLLVRLRPEGKAGKQLAQALYDNFQDDVEKRARAAGVKVRLHKQLVELEKQFYGSSFAYDKAIKGDGPEDLPAALHRNVYQKAEGARETAAVLARYIKREMACLAMTDSDVVFQGNIRLSALRLLPQPPAEDAPTGAAAAGDASAAAGQQGGGGGAAAGAAS